MDNRTTMIAAWVLTACTTAFGLSLISGLVFDSRRPIVMGYPIAGVTDTSAGVAAVAPIAVRLAHADAAKGAAVFRKCAVCHTIDRGGPNGQGPNLYATVGAAIAQGKDGFAFSQALKNVGGTWTFARLDAWLANPNAFASGTRMIFAGLSDPMDRANVILYLNQQGSNVPLPPLPVPQAPMTSASSAPGNRQAPSDTGKPDPHR